MVGLFLLLIPLLQWPEAVRSVLFYLAEAPIIHLLPGRKDMSRQQI